ncbi:DUF3667 domain-containing protein [Cellulophaga sp. 20_2_10]|uniref:DUF3667 domain-containing protein n=1 Tax=Cellulophaga sp. 20_2_10 TaxID=2942476 RepID=UPI00201A84A6|nr:DUF3667 domain-containing protein [Cellulophaga sp. 20_2_10]MCL5247107.1 DUF3667 domain-containing protein [Cellulophaga sp. 20_2_10]
MNCKTCNTKLNNNNNYCSNCGAKIVLGRISLKGAWQEFIGPFFSWDNNFWKTFLNLFTNPKDVLEAYISGARKKYFQPFSYLVVYATIALIINKIFPSVDATDFSDGFKYGTGDSNSKKVLENFNLIYQFYTNYYNLIIISSIPTYSLLTYLTFKKRDHNYSEHLVFNAYIQANLGYALIVMQLIFFNLLELSKGLISSAFILTSAIYALYVFIKLYQLTLKQTLYAFFRYVAYIILAFIILIIISIGVVILYAIATKTN